VAGFLLWCLASLAFGAAGGYLAHHYDRYLDLKLTGNAGDADAEAEDSAGPRTTPPANSTAESVRTNTGELKALAARIDAIVEQNRALKERLDAEPPADSSPNLTALQLKVADLSKTTAELAPLIEKMERHDMRIENLHQMLNSVHQELAGIRSKVAKATASTTLAPSASSAGSGSGTPLTVVPDASRRESSKPVLDGSAGEVNPKALAVGVKLFRAGKYQEAFEAFSRLELTNPNDARVWYYAALSRGFSTNHWGNGTEQLVERGIERERAGTPKTIDIDDTFRDLTSATGKDWLAAYRQRVKEQ
jgi:hypothetical protein